LSENRKENRQIKFRVNDLEFQRLEQMAKDFGMSVPCGMVTIQLGNTK